MKPEKNISCVVVSLIFIFLLSLSAFASEKVGDNSEPESCKACHAIQPYFDSWKSGDMLAHSHAEAGISCADCHDQYIANGVNKKDSSKALKKRKFDDVFCLRCHDFKEVNEKVVFKEGKTEARPHSQHVGDLNCSECHSMHSQSVLLCAKCHVQPWMKDLPKGWKTPQLYDYK